VLRGGWFGGVAGIMLGFGVSYAVVTAAWSPEHASSGAPTPPAGEADPGRGPYDQVLAVCTPGWIVALLLGVAVGAGVPHVAGQEAPRALVVRGA
jgi:hypothetical protein